MSIRGLKKWALMTIFSILLQFLTLQADQTVTGNLTITGTTDSQGNMLSVGTRTDNSDAGWWAGYTDGSTSVIGQAEGTANRLDSFE